MYDTYTGRFLQEDPDGFDAGDINLYRYVKNSPTNGTDPSGMQEARPAYGTLQFWQTQTRQMLDISGSQDTNFVRRAMDSLDSTFRLETIPTLSPNTPAPTFTAITPDRSFRPRVMGPPGGMPVPGQLAAASVIARINIRVNLINLKQTLVNQIYGILSMNPPRARFATNSRVTTPQEWASAANGAADVYIRAVDDFLRVHPGARPQLGQRSAIADFFGWSNEVNSPWCADWALGINLKLQDNSNTNSTREGGLLNSDHYQIRFRDIDEHNVVILSPKNRPPQLYPTYDRGILILDPWLDLLPRAYTPGSYGTRHVPTHIFRALERNPMNEPMAPNQ